MAVSLAFGVIFATFITLVLVPVAYLILDDVQRVGRRLVGRSTTAPAVALVPSESQPVSVATLEASS